MSSFVEKLPKANLFIFVTGSLAVSVTDMTAPVVGSSGGVYALVSAHLANVVMVSLWVCACPSVQVWMIISSLSSCHYRALTHHQSWLFEEPAGAALSSDAMHSSRHHRFVLFPEIKKCVHTFMWQCVMKSYRTAQWHLQSACSVGSKHPNLCVITDASGRGDLNLCHVGYSHFVSCWSLSSWNHII